MTEYNLNMVYKTDYMNYLNNVFRKEGLEFLKKKYNKTTDDFIKATYLKKDQANMRVKISRLINKPKNSPHYFGALELAEQLAKYFNQFIQNGDPYLGVNFFIGQSAKISIVGSLYGNGQIGLYKKNEIKKTPVSIRFGGCVGIISRIASSNGLIRMYKPRNMIYTGADNRFGVVQCKKSKIVYFGFIEPKSNGKYDILDKSYSTGKTIGKLAEDIDLSWSSRIEGTLYASYYDY